MFPFLVFPFHDRDGLWNWENGYARVKPSNPSPDAKGRPKKYLAPYATQSRVYIPPFFCVIGNRLLPDAANPSPLADVTIPLIPVEGEKKTDVVAQHGFLAVGFTGCWNWTKKQKGPNGEHRLIDDFEAIPLDGREIYLMLDSDVTGNKGIAWAEWCFAKALMAKGAKVRCCRIPPLPNGEKAGIDDLLEALKGTCDPKEVIQELIDTAVEPNEPSERFLESPADDELPFLCESHSSNPFSIGDRVRPKDRNNFGNVIETDANGCVVHFKSPSGNVCDKWFPVDELYLPSASAAKGNRKTPKVTGELAVTCLADIKAEPMEWLIDQHLPLGGLTVIYGDGKVGKSVLLASIAAAGSRGLPALGLDYQAEPFDTPASFRRRGSEVYDQASGYCSWI